jgi:hypothetical protein
MTTQAATKRPSQVQQIQALKSQLNTMAFVQSTLISRLKMFSQVGMQYDDNRDIYKALGYKRSIAFEDYKDRYLRQDIAKAVIDRPVKATWRGGIVLLESKDDKETPFEKAWKDLYKKFKLRSKFVRADKLSSVGYYGILLLGLSDVKNSTTDFKKPVSGKPKLLYIKPLSEGSATISKWETNPQNERYGLPLIYDITIQAPGEIANSQISVHHSRVIHIVPELLESETEGVPVLQAVFNRLFDLEKLVGAGAEMFWRGARPGYMGEVDPDAEIPAGFLDTLQDQFDEFEHNLRRFFVGEGLKDIKSLAQQIATNPEKYFDIQIQVISAVTGIPKRILVGSERGELASTQDDNAWRELIQDRRDDHAEPNIIVPFVDKCIELQILPKPSTGEYNVQWVDLWSPSEKEKAETGKIRAEALRNYASEPLSTEIVPPNSFRRGFLGMSDEEIELIEEEQKQAIKDETDDFSQGDDDGEEET